jgi:DNA-binding CsgD family transcriptional regulator/tetratricopeptide (TPR) repeat protein
MSDDLLLGRERETSLLEQALEEVKDGSKRALILSGEPGMGKSMLLRWVQRCASERGFVSGAVRVPSMGGLTPLFPLTEMLSALDKAQLRNRSTSDPYASGRRVTEDPMDQRPTDVLAAVRALERSGDLGPIGIFVDDLQWAQPEGLGILYSALRLAEANVLLVTTTRDGLNSGPLPISSSDLPVEFVVVPGLDHQSIVLLAERFLKGPVLPSLSRSLHERTLGNPLLATEMLRSWKESAAITALAGGFWALTQPRTTADSRSLLDMISERLDGLAQTSLDAAATLAILGHAGRPDELRSILGLSIAEVVNALAELEEGGVAERYAATGSYQLTHPLFQSALIQGLGETRKADLHGRIFDALVRHPDSSAAKVAYHAIRALERPPRLIQHLREAALEAERHASYAEAAIWYEKLAEATDDPNLLLDSLAGRAAAAEHFNPRLAVDIYGRAISVSGTGDELARLLLGRARAWRMAGKPEYALRDLEAAAVESDGGAALEIRDTTAVMHAVLGHGQLATAQFMELAEESTGTPVHVRVLGHLATAAFFGGRITEARDLSREALSHCDDLEGKQYLHMNLGWLDTLLGEWGEAKILLESAIDDARKANDLWLLVPLMTSATVLAVWQGELDRALDLGSQALRITDETYLMDRLGAMGSLGLALLERGAVSEAADLLSAAPALVDSSSEKNEVQLSLLVLGDCLLQLGDHLGCEAVLDQLRSSLDFNLSWGSATDRLEAQLLMAKRQPESALSLVSEMLEDPSEIAVERAAANLVAAQAFQTLGRYEEARQKGHLALSAYSSLGAHLRVKAVKDWLDSNSRRGPGRPRTRLVAGLTPRELEVLGLIVKGHSNADIGGVLFISTGTVKKHIENIRLKIGARRRGELISMGLSLLAGSRPGTAR